jgi:hypothetical protein
MSSTGGKTSNTKLGSLALSADHLVYLYPQSAEKSSNTPQPAETDSYTERLHKEHAKILHSRSPNTTHALDDPIDAHLMPVLELETDQMLNATRSHDMQKNTEGAHTEGPIADAVNTVDLSLDVSGVTQGDKPAPSLEATLKNAIRRPKITRATTPRPPRIVKKVTAPRAAPFSEEAYVRVKVIAKKIDLEGQAPDTPATEQICWMQRDAIKHYLCIQDIEKRRAAVKGAVYRSYRHDA